MTNQRILELLQIERECVVRGNTCGRTCATCELVQSDKDLLEMYDTLIEAYSPKRGLRAQVHTLENWCEIPQEDINKILEES